MRKNCRSLLLASLALTCGLLASCLSSGPEKPLGAMADAMEKNDSAAFLAQMDMPLFAANEARNMTNENEALNMLDSLGQDLGLGGMDQLLGSALNMEDKLRKSLTRGVSTGELMAHCRKAERPDCPWVPESLRNAKVVELGPDAAVASVTTPAGMTSWLALRKQGETWRVVGRAVMENMARAFAQAGSQTKAAIPPGQSARRSGQGAAARSQACSQGRWGRHAVGISASLLCNDTKGTAGSSGPFFVRAAGRTGMGRTGPALRGRALSPAAVLRAFPRGDPL